MFPIVKRNRSQHKCQRNRHLASCAISPPKSIPNLWAIKPEKDGILSRHPLVHTITAKNLPNNFGNPSKQESHCLNWKDVGVTKPSHHSTQSFWAELCSASPWRLYERFERKTWIQVCNTILIKGPCWKIVHLCEQMSNGQCKTQAGMVARASFKT